MTKQTLANLGFEQKLWAAADKLRGHMGPAEYKHVVLGLIFLKYISDSFEETYQSIKNDSEASDKQESATKIVLEQAELLAKDWTGN